MCSALAGTQQTKQQQQKASFSMSTIFTNDADVKMKFSKLENAAVQKRSITQMEGITTEKKTQSLTAFPQTGFGLGRIFQESEPPRQRVTSYLGRWLPAPQGFTMESSHPESQRLHSVGRHEADTHRMSSTEDSTVTSAEPAADLPSCRGRSGSQSCRGAGTWTLGEQKDPDACLPSLACFSCTATSWWESPAPLQKSGRGETS